MRVTSTLTLALLGVVLLGIPQVGAVSNLTAVTMFPDAPPCSLLVFSSCFDGNNVVGMPGDSAPGFPVGSFASDGTGKTDIHFVPESLFGRAVALGEVAGISYWTKKGTTHAVDPRDWYLAIYAKPFAGDVSSPTWYGARIGSEPYFSMNLSDPSGAWNQWTTDGASNRLRFFESTAGAPGATFGSYSDPDWAAFLGGNALGTLVPRSGLEILYFSVQTGSAWAAGFTGQLDGLRIELTDGSVATVNFDVPLSKDDCKKGGWANYGFKNQGQCIQFVNTGK